MVAMANQNQCASLARKLQRFEVYLRNQRASGVDHAQLPLFRLNPYARWHAMRAEYQDGAFRDFFDRLHKYRPAPPELVHHVAVMNDLVVHVYRAAKGLQRQFHDIYRSNHASAKAPRPDANQCLSAVRRTLYVG